MRDNMSKTKQKQKKMKEKKEKPMLDMFKEIKRIMRKSSWKWTQKGLIK